MTMIRWQPWREMMTLREAMDQLFEDSFVRPGQSRGVFDNIKQGHLAEL